MQYPTRLTEACLITPSTDSMSTSARAAASLPTRQGDDAELPEVGCQTWTQDTPKTAEKNLKKGFAGATEPCSSLADV